MARPSIYTPHMTDRFSRYDWHAIAANINAQGYAVLPRLLEDSEAVAIVGLYDGGCGFRSHVQMARHGFGRGEYRYFSYPLPPLVADLRESAYTRLSPIANGWHERMGLTTRFPETHGAFIARCHKAEQARPTPLLLRYGPEDYNCLHQDLYGEHVFPIQIAILLNAPGEDFTGGEFILTEQRPRMQSRAEVVQLAQGDAVLFAVNDRPVKGSRGDYRVKMRHGVSRVKSGKRHVLGIIFHDAV